LNNTLEHIYVVVGSGNSDIGKGWLTAAIASVLPNALPVKIDPLFNVEFPADIGIYVGEKLVSEDLGTYQKLGLPVFPESNLLNGRLMFELLQRPAKVLSRGSVKKITFADISVLLAEKLASLPQLIDDCKNMVIEIGGIITDRENVWIPDALRLLGIKTGIVPELVILSYLDYSEVGFPIKTQNVRYAIRKGRSHYGLPIKACFVRRRYLPDHISEAQIRPELQNIAFETQMPQDAIVFEENFADVFELKSFVESTGVFANKLHPTLVSACLLGIPCRYDGGTTQLNWQVLKELGSGEFITICPELLAGFSVPRTPCEIVGGDGIDVLNGTARVLTADKVDVTEKFILGAQKAVEVVLRLRPKRFILCDKSPSCGVSNIYDGTFSHVIRNGCGVFPALLKKNGFEKIEAQPVENSRTNA
jgi:uncharacterized protein YbbK (DUF523 family)